ncbi:acetamidase/formamidase family protein [Ktedonospora formicarum]|uniref:Acetamidase n=1 Tax=Ktedonospora formicarum TaxID=2778364 RepID=A0A8J3MSN7_9CHLR|nr:acetamidase/formamidase family protein [Ktedonospora formicarum]GHO45056.1 acetamidase [Ktedonospora formicarum]
MTNYTIEPERATLRGSFSREYPPIVTIKSGDTVRFSTLDAGWHLGPATEPLQSRFEPRDNTHDSGHALCGPVAIQEAQPGMTLEIQINEIRPGNWGWTSAGGRESAINKYLGLVERRELLHWALNTDAMVGTDQYGHTIALHPFMGVMGMPPDEPGIHSTIPPRFCGGNIDCKELVAGSTLFLPISVPGALFSVGDGHAAQGDGEVSGVAIECPMECVDLTFHVLEDMALKMPRVRTADAWVTLGFHENLHEASLIALDAMLDLMREQYDLPRSQAFALASLVVDLRITQIANGVHGVHAILPDGFMK